MSKYVRQQPSISRQSDSSANEETWLNRINNGLEKGAVLPRSTDNSLFHQINSIMNGKSKYPSVAAAVEDMKARSGLTAYLDKMSKTSEDEASVENKKIASSEQEADSKLPIIIQKNPNVKNTLENYIKDTKGNLPIPAIIEKIKSIHRNDVSDSKDWEDERLIRLVSQMNLQAKKDNPASFQQYNNLGSSDRNNNSDIDISNTDAFNILNPVKL